MTTRTHIHIALITCGACGNEFRIGLGLASAVLCPKCKAEIRLGED